MWATDCSNESLPEEMVHSSYHHGFSLSVEGQGTRKLECVTFEGKIFQWWSFVACYLMSIFTNLSTCGFTKRSEGKLARHRHDPFPVVVEKGALEAKPGWWGSSETCGTQSVTPSGLWREAVWEGTGCPSAHEPNWSPVTVNFLAYKLGHLQTRFEKTHKPAFFFLIYTENGDCLTHAAVWTFSVINCCGFLLFSPQHFNFHVYKAHTVPCRGVISAWLFTVPVLYLFLSAHFG